MFDVLRSENTLYVAIDSRRFQAFDAIQEKGLR